MDSAFKKAKDHIGQMFDKNMHDLVRGIRNHKETESKYIAECMDEIKQELKLDNIAIKTNAISKLCYLQMLGYDVSWAAFNIIEVMSSTKFTFKRIGYLAASQTFHEGTDVLMLTTNMIRKDLGSQNMYEAGIALSGLSCFLSADLARDLANEIMTLMTSSKPYLRKKAVLIMYKIFLKYPDALRPAFPRLKEKLEDPDPGVQAAAVNVICELARKNPKNYLSLAPTFFNLMNSSTNNWVLIKIIKLFGALTPLEPRLGKKLIEPLTNLIHSTSAMSLLYECINTVVAVLVSISSGLPNHNASIQLCVQKLRILIEDSDQNLKYLGLLAMSKILQTNPKSVQIHKDLIMQCLDDKDESIRLRALNLLYGMVSKKTLMEIIRKLMNHMNKAEGTHYRDELLSKIIDICSQNNYQYITNFEWYISVLVELTRMEGTKHGKLIATQLLDVTIRVESIREFAVQQMAVLIDNMHLFGANTNNPSGIATLSQARNSNLNEIFYAAAWICGEFSQYLNNPLHTMNSMLKTKVTLLPGHVQASFVQNIFKLYSLNLSKLLELDNDLESVRNLTTQLIEKIPMYEQNSDLEVQERACTFIQVLKYIQRVLDKNDENLIRNLSSEIKVLFEGELNPVATKAQRKVPLPDGLDLDEWIYEPPSESENDEVNENQIFVKNDNYKSLSNSSSSNNNNMTYSISSNDFKNNSYASPANEKKVSVEVDNEELSKRREARKLETEMNPYYIKPMTKKKSGESSLLTQSISKQKVSDSNEYNSAGTYDMRIPSSDSYYRMSKIDIENEKLKKKMKSKSKKDGKKKANGDVLKEDDDEEYENKQTVVIKGNEMPDGARDSDADEDKHKNGLIDPHRALANINLDEPLRDNEKLPVPKHHVVPSKKAVTKSDSKDSIGSTTTTSKVAVEEDTAKSDRKKKEKKEKAEKKHKKEKKEKKESKKEYNELSSPSQEFKSASEPVKPSSQQSNKKEDDIDFWLSTNTQTTEPVKEPLKETQVDNNKQQSNQEQSVKVKKHKKKHKDGKKDDEPNEQVIVQNQNDENEILNKKDIFQELVSNKHIKLTYKVYPNYMNLNQIIVDVEIKSSSIIQQVYSIEFNILETLNAKLVKDINSDSNGTIKVPFNLSSNQERQIQFLFSINDCTFPQKLKGTLTYMLKTEDESSMHEKLDFKFNLPCSAYSISSPCNSDEFTDWLSNGELTAKSSMKFQLNTIKIATNKDFETFIKKLCLNFNFSAVEIVDKCASLFTKTIKNQPLCLLIKLQADNNINIDGKSTNNNLLSNIMDEVKSYLG